MMLQDEVSRSWSGERPKQLKIERNRFRSPEFSRIVLALPPHRRTEKKEVNALPNQSRGSANLSSQAGPQAKDRSRPHAAIRRRSITRAAHKC